MNDVTPQSKNILVVAVIALLGVVVILLSFILFKDSPPEKAPEIAVNTPQLTAPPAAIPQAEETSAPPATALTSTPSPTPSPLAPTSEQKATIQDVAKLVIKISNAGGDADLTKLMVEVPPEHYAALVLEVDRQDAGMGAGFLDWLYRDGHRLKAETAYRDFPIEYKAKLLEVYSRNKMPEIAKFLYGSLDLPAQQQIRSQLRKDYSQTYTQIMRSLVD